MLPPRRAPSLAASALALGACASSAPPEGARGAAPATATAPTPRALSAHRPGTSPADVDHVLTTLEQGPPWCSGGSSARRCCATTAGPAGWRLVGLPEEWRGDPEARRRRHARERAAAGDAGSVLGGVEKHGQGRGDQDRPHLEDSPARQVILPIDGAPTPRTSAIEHDTSPAVSRPRSRRTLHSARRLGPPPSKDEAGPAPRRARSAAPAQARRGSRPSPRAARPGSSLPPSASRIITIRAGIEAHRPRRRRVDQRGIEAAHEQPRLHRRRAEQRSLALARHDPVHDRQVAPLRRVADPALPVGEEEDAVPGRGSSATSVRLPSQLPSMILGGPPRRAARAMREWSPGRGKRLSLFSRRSAKRLRAVVLVARRATEEVAGGEVRQPVLLVESGR